MSEPPLPPSPHPCGSCPYRRDVPSGIWHESEYAKLEAYDRETWAQPVGLFLCHQRNGRLCSGWVGCHDMNHSLAVRLAGARFTEGTLDVVFGYESAVPLFSSGTEAAAHGRAGIRSPDDRARRQIDSLTRKRARAGSPP